MDVTWTDRGKDGSRSRRHFPWTAENIERLKLLASSGMSGSQIAVEMGGELSRNAVIGKLHRLGIHIKRKQQQEVGPKSLKRTRDKKILRKRKPPMIPDDYQSPTLDVVPLNISFLALQPEQCRYVIGEPNGLNTLYCGHPVEGESSYCQCHFVACHEMPWKIRQAMKVAA